MSLKIIGAGWGRTGTVSLRTALTILGHTPHHMSEVFAHPEQAELFVEAADDPTFDWQRIYADYTATLDWPGCAFWRELADAYPEAKVLLSVRDPAQWFDSYRSTIYRPVALGWSDDHTGAWNTMARRVIVERSFDGEAHDRQHLTEAFRRHNETVQATIAPERLLVHRVDQGWGPLCEFLGLPVPDEPFPHLNTRATWG